VAETCAHHVALLAHLAEINNVIVQSHILIADSIRLQKRVSEDMAADWMHGLRPPEPS
jgi:hypothetical protein